MDKRWPEPSPTFRSLEAFYADDERRRHSPEADYGVWWTASSRDRRPPYHRVSYVRFTGEVYAVQITPGRGDGTVVVLGVVPPAPDTTDDDVDDDGRRDRRYYATLDGILEGWAQACMGEPDGLGWVRRRLASETTATR